MSLGLAFAPQHRVYAAFALQAVAMGSIFPRLPEIIASMNIGKASLGASLIGVPVGTILALSFATPFLERLGFRYSLFAAIPTTAIFYAVAVYANTPVVLFLLLVPAGVSIGCAEIIINVEADRTEALIGRRIMNRAHSFWSIGFFAAGLFGAILAYFQVSPKSHLVMIALLVGTAIFVLLRNFVPAPSRTDNTEPASMFARPTRPVLILVMVTLSAMLMEGAGKDWSAIYMDDVFGSGPLIAGLAFAIVAGSQALARFVADGFIDKYSPDSVARSLLLCLGIGIIVVVASPSATLSLMGFALIGIGTSVIFPLAISAAAQRTDRSATLNVAAVTQLSFGAFLIGPPLLGFVAEFSGIRSAFAIGLPFVVLSLVMAGALAPPRSKGTFEKHSSG